MSPQDYDGGDCCECTCTNGIDYTCGYYGFYCLDESAGCPFYGYAYYYLYGIFYYYYIGNPDNSYGYDDYSLVTEDDDDDYDFMTDSGDDVLATNDDDDNHNTGENDVLAVK